MFCLLLGIGRSIMQKKKLRVKFEFVSNIDSPYSIGYDNYTEAIKNHEIIRGFIESPRFHRRWNELGFTEDDLLDLQLILLDNPKIGPVMKETGGLRKMRFAFEGRGKSGSVRILYVDFEEHERILLMNVFSKNEKTNLTKGERGQIKKAMKQLETELFGGAK